MRGNASKLVPDACVEPGAIPDISRTVIPAAAPPLGSAFDLRALFRSLSGCRSGIAAGS